MEFQPPMVLERRLMGRCIPELRGPWGVCLLGSQHRPSPKATVHVGGFCPLTSPRRGVSFTVEKAASLLLVF